MIQFLFLVFCISRTFAVKCYVDNQGIPLEEAHGIIAEFKEFDCSLGGGTHQNCLKEIRESDGQMLIYRNCGLLEQRSGCETSAANLQSAIAVRISATLPPTLRMDHFSFCSSSTS